MKKLGRWHRLIVPQYETAPFFTFFLQRIFSRVPRRSFFRPVLFNVGKRKVSFVGIRIGVRVCGYQLPVLFLLEISSVGSRRTRHLFFWAPPIWCFSFRFVRLSTTLTNPLLKPFFQKKEKRNGSGIPLERGCSVLILRLFSFDRHFFLEVAVCIVGFF